MNTKILEKAIKQSIEKDITEAISEIDISYYLNPKQIKSWVESAIKNHVAQKVSEKMEFIILKEINKFEPKLTYEVQRMIAQEVADKLSKT